MKLEIKNLAKIKEANICLNGITVIAGENNTGKSTIGKTLHSFFTSLKNYPLKIQEYRRLRINNILIKHIGNEENIFNFRRESLFQGMLYNIFKLDEDYSNTGNGDGLNKGILDFLSKYKSVIEENEIEEIIEEIKASNKISDDVILKQVLTNNYSDIFNNQINNLNNEKEAKITIQIKNKNTEISFLNNNCKSIENPVKIINSSFFIEDNSILNELTNSHLRNMDKTNRDENSDVIADIIVKEKLEDIYKLLDNNNIGQVEKQDNGNYFYKSSTLRGPLEIDNLSMGLKSFVLLRTLLQKGSVGEKDVLIFDEPEIHLHPEWQVLYAHLLVLLQVTFNLTLVITSHSPYFIDAINLYAARYNALKNCSFYLSEMEDNQVIFEDVTKNIDKIYAKLAEPFDMLDSLRYELEEAGKLC